MMKKIKRHGTGLLLLLALVGCSGGSDSDQAAVPYASTYKALPSETVVIRNATILTGDGELIDDGSIVLEDGKITAIGESVRAPRGAQEIDGRNKWVTPGIIDVHSHLGVYPSPGVQAHSDGNEMTSPNTAEVWAEHSIWPQDPGFAAALAGGVTSLQILPGSANLFGGRSVTVKNVPSRTVQGMKFPGAPYGLKMACGENPKRVYGEGKKSAPATRMGNVAGYRAAWIEAQDYARKLKANKDNGGEPPYARSQAGDARRRAERRDTRAQPLLPGRRDGDHARRR